MGFETFKINAISAAIRLAARNTSYTILGGNNINNFKALELSRLGVRTRN